MNLREALQWVGVGAELGVIVFVVFVIPALFESGVW